MAEIIFGNVTDEGITVIARSRHIDISEPAQPEPETPIPWESCDRQGHLFTLRHDDEQIDIPIVYAEGCHVFAEREGERFTPATDMDERIQAALLAAATANGWVYEWMHDEQMAMYHSPEQGHYVWEKHEGYWDAYPLLRAAGLII